MKNFLIAVLLAVFSVQGTVAAMRNDIVMPSSAQENHLCASGLSADGAPDASGGKKVSASLEELSDYLAFELPVTEAHHEFAIPASPPALPLSPDLPRIRPPPRT